MGRALVNKTLKDLIRLIIPSFQVSQQEVIKQDNKLNFEGKAKAKRMLFIPAYMTIEGKALNVLITKNGGRIYYHADYVTK